MRPETSEVEGMDASDSARWVISYLRRIRKNRLAEGLERNRYRIMEEARLDA
jgi:hypothetical protein